MTKREALSLLDIVPRHEMVAVNDQQKLRVRGLSAEDIKDLLTRFPPLMALAVGRGITAETLVKLGPEIVGVLCAAATGDLGNEKAEKIAATLPVEIQLEILEAMGRCTFSKGFGPFVEKIVAIAKALSVEAGKAPDTNLPKPSKPSVEQPIPASGN